jgi:hypothetical protein
MAWVSLSRQVTGEATLAASTNPPWMSAQVHGARQAAGWLYTSIGRSVPSRPWWTTT